jgi:carboxynorspermidine decarboxylase
MFDYTQLESPAFILDKDRLRENLSLIKGVQDATGVKVILALKAFSTWPVFPLVKDYLYGATASSLNEARLIFEEMGVKAHTYAPVYFPEDMDELLEYSSHLTFNSLRQFEQYRDQARAKGISMGLRVNPEYSEVETDLYNPAVPGSRLGVLAKNLPETLPTEIEGLHVHTLCESSASATKNLLSAIEEKFQAYLSRLKWLNLGGGHLMTRKGYDLDLLKRSLLDFRDKYPHLEIILEPGSAIAWETGELVSTVLDLVESGGVTTAIVDVSFTAHMPDTLEMPYRPKILGAQSDPEGSPYRYRIGGVSCLAGDYMDEYGFGQALEIGDKLVFWDMIHYTMVKTTMFNGVKHPAIYLGDFSKGSFELIRKFGYEDFKSRLG